MAFYGFTAMEGLPALQQELKALAEQGCVRGTICLLYTSPSPRDRG